MAGLGALFLERQLLFAEWAHELPDGVGTTGTFPKEEDDMKEAYRFEKVPALKREREGMQEEIANYFGLVVEEIDRMENYSLIRYRDREFVVNTEELQNHRLMNRAA